MEQSPCELAVIIERSTLRLCHVAATAFRAAVTVNESTPRIRFEIQLHVICSVLIVSCCCFHRKPAGVVQRDLQTDRVSKLWRLDSGREEDGAAHSGASWSEDCVLVRSVIHMIGHVSEGMKQDGICSRIKNVSALQFYLCHVVHLICSYLQLMFIRLRLWASYIGYNRNWSALRQYSTQFIT